MALVLVLITSAWNLIRLWASLELWPALAAYAPIPGPAYVAITGGIWAGAGVVVTWAVLARRHWAPSAMLATCLAYAVWFWADRVLLQPYPNSGWQFDFILTALELGLIAAATLDRRNRHYFGREAHEREEQDRNAA